MPEHPIRRAAISFIWRSILSHHTSASWKIDLQLSDSVTEFQENHDDRKRKFIFIVAIEIEIGEVYHRDHLFTTYEVNSSPVDDGEGGHVGNHGIHSMRSWMLINADGKARNHAQPAKLLLKLWRIETGRERGMCCSSDTSGKSQANFQVQFT